MITMPLAAVLAAIAAAGCATPPGEVFSPLDHAPSWPPPPEKPRIKLVGSIASSTDLAAGQTALESFKSAVRGPRPPIKFSGPHMAARGPGQLLAVTDSSGAAVHILDLSARTHWVVNGWGSEELQAPVGAAWVDRRLFVTDAGRDEIIEFSASGQHVRSFGKDELQRPVGICYVPQRKQLYVVDGAAGQLLAFNVDGKLAGRYGGPGTEPGQFNYPTHIGYDGGNQLVVADSGSFRVQVLDLDGHCIRTIGQAGDAAGDLALPKGVAFDRDGHIYVVDARFENVQIFDDAGRLLLAFGGEGAGLGRFSLPAGIDIDDQDRIWVADSGNRRVQVFDYLRNAG